MPRVYIRNGELTGSYEPHALPGAFIVLRYAVIDSTGETAPAAIQWDGPGIWIDSRDGVPAGYRALWLGTEQATRPHIVYVSEAPTAESDEYDAAYRAGFTAKRKPVVTAAMSRTAIDGRLQGWADRRRSR